jgi:hypothetical protein
MTFLKIRSHPCSWWSRHKTPQSSSIAQDSFALVQVSWSPQLNASSVSHCSGLRIQPSCTLPLSGMTGWWLFVVVVLLCPYFLSTT